MPSQETSAKKTALKASGVEVSRSTTKLHTTGQERSQSASDNSVSDDEAGSGNENSADEDDESGDSDGSEDGEASSSEEEEEENVGVAMSLPKRGTRGKRFHAMVAEEAEADAAFWGQAAFQEAEEDDVDYVKTPDESADEVDSDFDIDETEAEVQETVRPGDDKQANSKAYKEPVRKRRQAAKPKLTAAERQERKRQRREYLRAAAASRVMRRSTKNKTAAMAEAAATEAEARRRARANRKKTKSHSRTAPITADGVVLEQKDMLMDAVRTEMANVDSLLKMKQKHLDDKVVVQRKEASGPRVRFLSKGGMTYLTFTGVDDFPAAINTAVRPATRAKACVITGKPARYIDPRTRLPYHDLAAYHALKLKYHNSSSDNASPTAGAAAAGGGL